jgi:hypothetical protein
MSRTQASQFNGEQQARCALNSSSRHEPAAQLRPRLLTIDVACKYAAVSRSEFYKTWLPRLRTVHAGKRHLVDRASLDQLIDELFAAG